MNICELSESDSVKLNSIGILISIIDPNQKYFQYTDPQLIINRALFVENENSTNSQSNPIIFLLFLFILLLFIAIALTDTGVLLGFNIPNR